LTASADPDTLPAMEDIRWQQRFDNLDKAFRHLHEAANATKQHPKDYLYQIALVGAFQFTFELSWKTVKDYLKYSGIDVSLPRDVIKQAFHHGIIQDGQTWIAMLEDRNLMAHVYQEEIALAVINNIQAKYIIAIDQVFHFLKGKRHE
jgi:nucleotidyltransferase substrate binding protein (TIGR01987 family)